MEIENNKLINRTWTAMELRMDESRFPMAALNYSSGGKRQIGHMTCWGNL